MWGMATRTPLQTPVENPGLQDHLEHSCCKATSSEQGWVRAVISFPQGCVSHCWSHFLSPAVLGLFHIYIYGFIFFSGFLKEGCELINEALNLFNNVYGAMHVEICACLRLLARLNYIMGDYSEVSRGSEGISVLSFLPHACSRSQRGVTCPGVCSVLLRP